MGNKVEYRVEDSGIAYLKMNDTERKNIFADDFVDELVAAFDKVEELAPKVLILQGLPDVFAGGADKKNLLELCEGKINVKDLIISEKLVGTSFPVIAAMEGHAMGGGLVMGACCDIVIAAKESRYGAVFMTLGFTPGMGATTLLPELVGTFIANEMLFTGKRFRGSQLEKMGTNINYILPKSEVVAKAEEIAHLISEKLSLIHI